MDPSRSAGLRRAGAPAASAPASEHGPRDPRAWASTLSRSASAVTGSQGVAGREPRPRPGNRRRRPGHGPRTRSRSWISTACSGGTTLSGSAQLVSLVDERRAAQRQQQHRHEPRPLLAPAVGPEPGRDPVVVVVAEAPRRPGVGREARVQLRDRGPERGRLPRQAQEREVVGQVEHVRPVHVADHPALVQHVHLAHQQSVRELVRHGTGSPAAVPAPRPGPRRSAGPRTVDRAPARAPGCRGTAGPCPGAAARRCGSRPRPGGARTASRRASRPRPPGRSSPGPVGRAGRSAGTTARWTGRTSSPNRRAGTVTASCWAAHHPERRRARHTSLGAGWSARSARTGTRGARSRCGWARGPRSPAAPGGAPPPAVGRSRPGCRRPGPRRSDR